MRVGQKVKIYGNEGFLVGITIDPLDADEVRYETFTYQIRVFKPFYKNGYADFYRSGHDLFQMHKEGNFSII